MKFLKRIAAALATWLSDEPKPEEKPIYVTPTGVKEDYPGALEAAKKIVALRKITVARLDAEAAQDNSQHTAY